MQQQRGPDFDDTNVFDGFDLEVDMADPSTTCWGLEFEAPDMTLGPSTAPPEATARPITSLVQVFKAERGEWAIVTPPPFSAHTTEESGAIVSPLNVLGFSGFTPIATAVAVPVRAHPIVGAAQPVIARAVRVPPSVHAVSGATTVKRTFSSGTCSNAPPARPVKRTCTYGSSGSVPATVPPVSWPVHQSQPQFVSHSAPTSSHFDTEREFIMHQLKQLKDKEAAILESCRRGATKSHGAETTSLHALVLQERNRATATPGRADGHMFR
jgi:hypothetical protein